jgi:magnesium transporter
MLDEPVVAKKVVNCAAYCEGKRTADLQVCDVGAEVARGDRFVWIGVHEPDEELLRELQQQFCLHDLAIEDAHAAHQRPKLEVYGDSLFMVLQTAQLVDNKIAYGETHLFVGRGYVVSIRHGPSLTYADVRKRCESTPKQLARGESFVLYALMDFIVDNYMPIVGAIERQVDEIEDTIFSEGSRHVDVARIYRLRRELLMMHRVVSPVREICARLMRGDVPVIDTSMEDYFRDVADHAIRVDEAISDLRELLTTALEAELMLAAARQNEVTRRLAAWAAILAVPTAIAGIYGMNFEHMPELKWEFGYFAVLGTVIGICGFLYFRFRRTGWL